MSKQLTPGSRPRMSEDDVLNVLRHYGVTDAVVLIVWRGYYLDTMGKPGVNDRGINDDAIFLRSRDFFKAYNGNADPSGYRKGHGFAEGTKGMASIKTGVWRAHKIGLHKGQYKALVQTAGKVTVIRDGNPPYEDTGHFGINIHRGGNAGTSSLGCCTVPPAQYDGFIADCEREMKQYGQSVMTVIVLDELDYRTWQKEDAPTEPAPQVPTPEPEVVVVDNRSVWQRIADFLIALFGPTNGASGDPNAESPSRSQVESPPAELPESGELENEEFPFLARALEITGAFEGKGYTQIAGNFDGQGISCGILQWNFGTGSLQRVILGKFVERHGKLDALGIFPMQMDMVLRMTNAGAVQYAKEKMLRGTKLKPEWEAAWQKFMGLPEVIILQRQGAASVAASANKIMNSFNMKGERAFCFFFDVVTQNGSMKGVKPDFPTDKELDQILNSASAENQKLWKPLRASMSTQQRLLLKAAYDRAKLSKPAYFQDVYSRKGTIALGRGFVHGRRWDHKLSEA